MADWRNPDVKTYYPRVPEDDARFNKSSARVALAWDSVKWTFYDSVAKYQLNSRMRGKLLNWLVAVIHREDEWYSQSSYRENLDKIKAKIAWNASRLEQGVTTLAAWIPRDSIEKSSPPPPPTAVATGGDEARLQRKKTMVAVVGIALLVGTGTLLFLGTR